MSNRLILPHQTWRGADLLYVLRKLGLTSNLRLCLDAGDAESYSSGQSWLDRSGNGYDFFRGADGSATGSDPTFNGTAGGRSSAEYWSFDGGDYFTYDTTNETWMQNLHKNNALFTLLMWWYVTSGDTLALWGSNGGAGSTGTGMHIYHSASALRFRVVNATATVLDTTSGLTIPTGWVMIGLSVDEAAGASGGLWFCNGNTETFDTTYSSPSSGNASNTMQIAARGNASNPSANGTRCAQFMAWEGRALTLGEIQAVFQVTRSRFGV